MSQRRDERHTFGTYVFEVTAVNAAGSSTASSVTVTLVELFTASVSTVPVSHGNADFGFRLTCSENFSVSYRRIRDHALHRPNVSTTEQPGPHSPSAPRLRRYRRLVVDGPAPLAPCRSSIVSASTGACAPEGTVAAKEKQAANENHSRAFIMFPFYPGRSHEPWG